MTLAPAARRHSLGIKEVVTLLRVSYAIRKISAGNTSSAIQLIYRVRVSEAAVSDIRDMSIRQVTQPMFNSESHHINFNEQSLGAFWKAPP